MPELKPLPSAGRLRDLVHNMPGRPIVVVADLVADRFITGTPKRISREAPVLILRHESERLVPGGGANAIANIAALGGRPIPLGVVGDDRNGAELVAALAALGVETAGILCRPGYRTPTKTRILGGGKHAIKQQIVRFDIEDQLDLTPQELDHFSRLARDSEAEVAVVSDYGYGAAAPEAQTMVRQSLASGATLLVDSRYRLGEFKGVDGATPNEEEAEVLFGRPLGESLSEVSSAGRQLKALLRTSFLLITRGSRGMTLVESDRAVHLPVHGTDQVADVTGAGDTVIGTFALALAAGATALEAAMLANYAGGLVVMKMGTATLSPDELIAGIEASPIHPEAIPWVEHSLSPS